MKMYKWKKVLLLNLRGISDAYLHQNDKKILFLLSFLVFDPREDRLFLKKECYYFLKRSVLVLDITIFFYELPC